MLTASVSFGENKAFTIATLNSYSFFNWEEGRTTANKPHGQIEYSTKAGHLIGLLPSEAPLCIEFQEIGGEPALQAVQTGERFSALARSPNVYVLFTVRTSYAGNVMIASPGGKPFFRVALEWPPRPLAIRQNRNQNRTQLSAEYPSKQPESLSGLIERVTFFDEENGFAVLKVKARGQRDLVMVVGSLPSVSAGEWVTAQGHWIQDREFGLQFRAELLNSTAPTTREGIEKYLGSGMVKGIGPVYARKLVEKFGETIFDVIEKKSGRLEEVDGIGPNRRQRISAAWAEQKVIRDIMVFCRLKDNVICAEMRLF